VGGTDSAAPPGPRWPPPEGDPGFGSRAMPPQPTRLVNFPGRKLRRARRAPAGGPSKVRVKGSPVGRLW